MSDIQTVLSEMDLSGTSGSRPPPDCINTVVPSKASETKMNSEEDGKDSLNPANDVKGIDNTLIPVVLENSNKDGEDSLNPADDVKVIDNTLIPVPMVLKDSLNPADDVKDIDNTLIPVPMVLKGDEMQPCKQEAYVETMENFELQDSIKLPDHTQPSDYSDVQPKTYDPDFISQISSKMQVPDRISVGSDYESRESSQHDYGEVSSFVRMTVPDRIVLAVEEDVSRKDSATPTDNAWTVDAQTSYTVMEVPYRLLVGGQDVPGKSDNQHIGMRQDMEMDLPANPHKTSDMSYVGLITPPRTLTLEERFPAVEATDDQKLLEAQGGSARHNIIANGHVVGPVPYDPGVNLNESVLLNEENEATLLRTQVAKLTRRVQVIEQDNQRRASRELVMYPVILGYFLWKLLGWLTRDR